MLPGRDPDALTPDVVASRSFAFAKRGYEAREVQDFQREVAEELRVLRSHAAELVGQLESTRAELAAARELDEDQLAEALGEETKAVLAAARTAAASIRSRAEDERAAAMAQAAEEAEEIRAGARADADRIRAETEQEVAGHLQAAATTVAEAREEAVATAEQATVAAAETVEQARQRGREMVAEAQAVRERMLKDLARRRKVLRQQIDQLQAGRDRLLAAYDVVLRTATEATGEMGEVLEEAREAAQAAARASGGSTADADLDIIAAIEQIRLERGLAAEALDTEELEQVEEPVSDEVPVVAEAGEEPTDGLEPGGPAGSVGPEAVPVPPDAAAPVAEAEGGAEEPAEVGEPPVAEDRAGAGAPEAADAEEPTGPAGAAGADEPPEVEATEEPGASEEAAATEAPDEAAAEAGEDGAGEPVPGGRGGRGERRRSLFGRAGGDVPKAPPPAEHEGRFSSAVRVFSREGEDEAEAQDLVAEGAPADEPLAAEAAPEGSEDAEAVAPSGRSPGLFERLRQEQAASQPTEEEALEEAEAAPSDDSPAAEATGSADEAVEAVEDERPADEQPADDGEPGGDAALLAQRDAALATLDATLRRRLKRTLADEENEVLDALRRHTGQVEVDLLLPSADDHLRRYADATLPTLAACAAGGVDFLREGWPDLVAEAPRTRVGDLAEGAAEDLVVPLRQVLARQVAGTPDDTDALLQVVRDTYRDWRHARIEPVARQVASTAFHRALAEHVAEGTRLRWVLGGPTEPSPDCGANAEAEPVVRGQPFPDGSTVPPCGAGCRCLVVPEA